MNPSIHCKYDELVLTASLKDHPKNRNKHGDDQLERLAKLYSYHGIRHPIIVSKQSGFIVAGHGRKGAALKAGIEKMPVVFQDFSDEKAEYAFIQADNAIALWAELDVMSIKDDVADLGDFDLDMLGLKNLDIDILKEAMADEDEVPEVKIPKSVPGDLYLLGNHRLLCGDSTSIDAVYRLMDGQKADMVFTDPPYNVNYEGSDGQKIQNDNMTNDEFLDFCRAFFGCFFSSMKEGAGIYVFHSSMEAGNFCLAFKEVGFHFSSYLIWNKDSLIMGRSDYHWKHEPCLYGWKPGASHNWYSDRKQTTIFDHAKGSGTDNKMHPTCKPISLVEYYMGNSSKKDDLVLDLFGGSGSTLITAEKMNRRCNMMELDPKYVDVIVTRYCNYTGKTKVNRNGQEIEWPIKDDTNG